MHTHVQQFTAAIQHFNSNGRNTTAHGGSAKPSKSSSVRSQGCTPAHVRCWNAASSGCWQEFKACLRSESAAGLKLSRQDVNTLLAEVDADGNGLVDYEVSNIA